MICTRRKKITSILNSHTLSFYPQTQKLEPPVVVRKIYYVLLSLPKFIWNLPLSIAGAFCALLKALTRLGPGSLVWKRAEKRRALDTVMMLSKSWPTTSNNSETVFLGSLTDYWMESVNILRHLSCALWQLIMISARLFRTLCARVHAFGAQSLPSSHLEKKKTTVLQSRINAWSVVVVVSKVKLKIFRCWK